jgi:hypothetical protein
MTQEESTSKNEQGLLSALRQHLDEMRVQMSLGKADASDYLEEQKAKFADRLESAKDMVEKSPLIDNDLTKSIKARMDQLKLQLALGKMETKDACREQKEKIARAIDSLRDTTAPLKESANEAFAEFSDVVEGGAEFLKAKLSALGARLMGDEGEEVESTEEEVPTSDASEASVPPIRKAELEAELKELAIRADQAAELSGDELKTTTDELKAAYDRVTEKLNKLL